MITKTQASHTRRVEDDALVRGRGQFMDDPRLPNQAYAAFAPHAHARVLSVNAEEARKGKGVLAILTAADIKAAGIAGISRHPPVVGRGGAKTAMPFRPVLAETAMHVGDAVAMVVAESHAAAQDAADLVQVEYEELTPVIELDAAMKAATQLHADAPGNHRVDWPGRSRATPTRARWPDLRERGARGARAASSTSASSSPRWRPAAPRRATTRESDSYLLRALAGRRLLRDQRGVSSACRPRSCVC